jgi:pimeloyl-ACP methyl ester carboxylesterase
MAGRRPLILGSAATLGLGAIGVLERRRHPTLLRQLQLDRSPDYTPRDFHVPTERGELSSRHMTHPVKWRISIPRRPPVATVFCLHGRGGNQDAPFERLPDVAEENDAPLAFAGVDGGDHLYWHRRRDGNNPMAMLIEELIPLVQQRTRTVQRAVIGWSMGGYGALLAAQSHPAMFRAVAALSPAVWEHPGDAAPGAFDGPADFREHDVFAGQSTLADTPVFIACGSGDPFLAISKRFVSGLPHAQSSFGHGYHDPAYWRSVAPTAVRFLRSLLMPVAAGTR